MFIIPELAELFDVISSQSQCPLFQWLAGLGAISALISVPSAFLTIRFYQYAGLRLDAKVAAAGVATWISVAGSGFVFYLIIESWLILVLAVCEPILFFLVLISVGVWTRNDFTTLAHPRERLPPHSACCKSCVALDCCVPCCTANPVCKVCLVL